MALILSVAGGPAAWFSAWHGCLADGAAGSEGLAGCRVEAGGPASLWRLG